MLARELAEIPHIEMLYDGQGALPAVCYKLKTPETCGFTMYDLSERVRMRGWQIASYPLPANRQETVVQRILVRHGVTHDMACMLLDDIKRAVKHQRTRCITPKRRGATTTRGGDAVARCGGNLGPKPKG